jgi:hypothetical protein
MIERKQVLSDDVRKTHPIYTVQMAVDGGETWKDELEASRQPMELGPIYFSAKNV